MSILRVPLQRYLWLTNVSAGPIGKGDWKLRAVRSIIARFGQSPVYSPLRDRQFRAGSGYDDQTVADGVGWRIGFAIEYSATTITFGIQEV